MSTPWNSLTFSNMLLPWYPIIETQMSHFVTVSEDLQEECQSAMLHKNMNISHLMMHSIRVQEVRAKINSRDDKRARSFDGRSSKNRLEIQDKLRFKKRVSIQVPSKFPKDSGDRVSNPKFNKGKGTNSPTEKPSCGKCGKKHYGDCLKGTNNCFNFSKSFHKMRDFPNFEGQDNGSVHAQASGSSDAPKKNRFYVLRSREDKRLLPTW